MNEGEGGCITTTAMYDNDHTHAEKKTDRSQ